MIPLQNVYVTFILSHVIEFKIYLRETCRYSNTAKNKSTYSFRDNHRKKASLLNFKSLKSASGMRHKSFKIWHENKRYHRQAQT